MTPGDATSRETRIEAVLSIVGPVVSASSGMFARRFGIAGMADEIEAESVARVVGLVSAGRSPFDRASLDGEAADRAQRFARGLVANVAREVLRGRVRHGHGVLDERASVCAGLASDPSSAVDREELETAIGSALERFRGLGTEDRETIVAEECIQHGYSSGDMDRLCRASGVSFQRVLDMISSRESGVLSPEAWRQRVHRSRKRARAVLGSVSLFAVAMALVVGALASAPGGTDAGSGEPGVVAPARADSTQNGKKKSATVRLASTQNGNSGTSMNG